MISFAASILAVGLKLVTLVSRPLLNSARLAAGPSVGVHLRASRCLVAAPESAVTLYHKSIHQKSQVIDQKSGLLCKQIWQYDVTNTQCHTTLVHYLRTP